MGLVEIILTSTIVAISSIAWILAFTSEGARQIGTVCIITAVVLSQFALILVCEGDRSPLLTCAQYRFAWIHRCQTPYILVIKVTHIHWGDWYTPGHLTPRSSAQPSQAQESMVNPKRELIPQSLRFLSSPTHATPSMKTGDEASPNSPLKIGVGIPSWSPSVKSIRKAQ